MRIALLRMFLLLAAAAGALAQNSDLGLMLGVSHVVRGFTSGTTTATIGPGGQVVNIPSIVVTGHVSAGGQINYAIQLNNNPHFYFEIPVHITGSSTGTVTGTTVADVDDSAFFITPGIRWNLRPAARVSIYAAAGAGAVIAVIHQRIAGINFAGSSNDTRATLAFDYGMGLDLRLTRLVSFRTEIRQALMAGNILGRHHDEFFTAGIGLHF